MYMRMCGSEERRTMWGVPPPKPLFFKVGSLVGLGLADLAIMASQQASETLLPGAGIADTRCLPSFSVWVPEM